MSRTFVETFYLRKLKSESGFGIASVLIAAAMLAVITLAISKVITNGQQGQKAVSDSVEFSILKSNIQKIVDNQLLCSTAFQTKIAPITNLTVLNNGIGTVTPVGQIRLGTLPVASQGMEISPGLQISKLEMRQLTGGVAAGGGFQFQVALILEATKEKGGYGGNILSNDRNNNFFMLNIQTDNTNKIESCVSKTLPLNCPAGRPLIAGADPGTFDCGNFPPPPPPPIASCGAGQYVIKNAGGAITCAAIVVPPTVPPPPAPPTCRIATAGTGACTSNGVGGLACPSTVSCLATEKAMGGGTSCVSGILLYSNPAANGWQGGCWAQASPAPQVGTPGTLSASSWANCCTFN